jgi:hypothetical protein
MGLGVSFLTTFFTFRWFFSLFPGRPNEAAEHAHEAPRVMTLPLIILAAGVFVVTLPRFMDFEAWITGWLPAATLASMPHGEGGHGFVMPIAVSLQLIGLYLAYSIYYRKTLDSWVFIARLKPLHTLVVNRFYLDHRAMVVYQDLFAPPIPRYRLWDGAWGNELGALEVGGTPAWIVLKAAPTRRELGLVLMDREGVVSGQVWQNGTWRGPAFLSSTGVTYRAFDLEYESQSGRAVVVYSDGSSVPKYRIWDGSTLSPEGSVSPMGSELPTG